MSGTHDKMKNIHEKAFTEEVKKLKKFEKSLNQAGRIRYQIIQRKSALWDNLADINKLPADQKGAAMEKWFERCIKLSKKEAKIIEIFRQGVDNALAFIIPLDKEVNKWFADKNIPEEFRRSVAILKKVFLKVEDLVTLYQKRIKHEADLFRKEQKYHRRHS